MPSSGNDSETRSVSISISGSDSDSDSHSHSHSPLKNDKYILQHALSRTPTPTQTANSTPIPTINNQTSQQLKPPNINSNLKSTTRSSSPSLSLPNRMLSLSTTSLTSLLPSLYNLGSNTNSSMPTITSNSTLGLGSGPGSRASRINQINEQGSNHSLISQSGQGQGQQQSSASDELARESDLGPFCLIKSSMNTLAFIIILQDGGLWLYRVMC
ncbi:unnamed protein product [Ambrosiozyma monospora]|uniref:Unnamed protein product n=1 Tax=Ambrosiozyma monospora TaxID=43982 RepID=A0ACB5SX72_AMBMO|nr:unnamed protein product [Ambrosiozyma monospora]